MSQQKVIDEIKQLQKQINDIRDYQIERDNAYNNLFQILGEMMNENSKQVQLISAATEKAIEIMISCLSS